MEASNSISHSWWVVLSHSRSSFSDEKVLFSFQDEPGDGLFTEGCFALVEGEYTEEATLEIIAIGQPPCEPRETSR